MKTNPISRVAGIALVASSLAFVAVFTVLAMAMDYPDVLDRRADQVLPLLIQGGAPLRAVWFLYAALPFGLVLGGVGSAAAFGRTAPGLRTVGVAAALVAGVAMTAGLIRWPTLMWALAHHWREAPPAAQAAMAAVFDGANLLLGNVVGEFVGEVALATWFVALGMALHRQGRRVLGGAGVAAGAVVAVAALRNVTGAVALVAEASNLVLPAWLLVLGIVFLRSPSPVRTAAGPGYARSTV